MADTEAQASSGEHTTPEESHPLDEIDRLIHEPARMVIMAILSEVEGADFLFLRRQTGLTAGNLSSHLSRLEDAGHVEIEKTYRGKVPQTMCRITPNGSDAFAAYRNSLGQVLGI